MARITKTSVTIAIALAASAAACGSSTPTTADAHAPDAAKPADAPTPDAPPPDASTDAAPAPDLSCLGDAPTTSVADPLVVGGKVFAITDYQVAALASVPVSVRRTSDDGVLGSGTTGSDGAFSISVASGGVAPDAYIFVDDGVHRPTYATAGAPLTASLAALVIVADDAELGRWYTDAGATWDASQATVIAAVTDCQPKSVAGSITASPAPAHLAYYDPSAPRWNASLTSSANGFVLLAGAAATETITAHVDGHDFPAHAVTARPGTLSLAVIPATD